MSISRNKPDDNDIQFSNIVYDQTEAKKASPLPVVENNDGKPQSTEAPANEAAADSNGKKKSGYLLDTLLVTTLVLIIGVSGYFIKTKLDEYRVPSAYEEACAENDRLQQEYNMLTTDKQKINEVQQVKELQSRIEQLDQQLAEARTHLDNAKSVRANLKESIQLVKQSIDSARYNLRETDRDLRAKAMAELPGLPIPVVTNRRTNSIVKNAVITKIEEGKTKKIHLRSDSAMVSWNVKDISRKELPPIMRYALGFADFVDMSILDEEGGKKTSKRPVIQPATPIITNQPAEDDDYGYDPTAGTPTIINSHTETISADPTATPDSEPEQEPVWDVPTGDLPI